MCSTHIDIPTCHHKLVIQWVPLNNISPYRIIRLEGLKQKNILTVLKNSVTVIPRNVIFRVLKKKVLANLVLAHIIGNTIDLYR